MIAAPPLGQQAGGLPAHHAETLDDHARAAKIQHLGLVQRVGADHQPETGRAQFIERTPPSTPGRPTARPISSWTYAIDVSLVPMSGPGV
jgi:hypothetical protein